MAHLEVGVIEERAGGRRPSRNRGARRNCPDPPLRAPAPGRIITR
jgi:hypothetical protein